MRLLREGETCWRRAHADRVAFLIDAKAYYEALASAVERAQHSVWLLGWDFYSSVRLRREEETDGPDRLVDLLDAIVRRNRSLTVRVLGWDYALLYALEREFLPLVQIGARTHRRIHFALDSAHPTTASQHQKVAVIDDRVAFAGGIDLTTHRWDTREHLADDPRRTTPTGETYQPFHDVQIAVDGQAAAELAELARDRWRRATRHRVKPDARRREATAPHDPWPEDLTPDAEDVQIGISRTVAAYRGAPEVREVETLFRESIAAARRAIFIENQYLTSSSIVEWLGARLEEEAGPEVVIVSPRANAGWLEEKTMGVLRDRALRTLQKADRHDRLRVLYPDVPGLGEGEIVNVHSKVMVVDDCFARIGSSNLSNRSMGLDTECDLAFESGGREDLRRAIRRLRDDLLAEHLGVSRERVAQEIDRCGSLVAAVDALRGGDRTLRPIEIESPESAAEAVDTLGAVDPEHPAPLAELVSHFARVESVYAPNRLSRRLQSLALLAVVIGLPLLWRFSPLGDWVEVEDLRAALGFFRDSAFGPLAAFAIFIAAALCFVPVTALAVATGLALGSGPGIAVAWLGSVAAAAIGHGLGHFAWRDTVRRMAGDRLQELNQRLARRGVLSSALVRIVPIAPFMVVNLVAGASQVSFRDFVLGSALGSLPGTIVLVIAADGVNALVAGAGIDRGWIWPTLVVLAGAGVVLGVRAIAARQRIRPGSL